MIAVTLVPILPRSRTAIRRSMMPASVSLRTRRMQVGGDESARSASARFDSDASACSAARIRRSSSSRE
ncbi:hypothetical protein DP49_5378 [Burkholderia pseudomallei]|nr:hypothetical protein DO63_5668 [Burkholderia pseudomallei]KGD58442.1 hypothetical protein DP49_5378 [Burkholderia pseudomallei]